MNIENKILMLLKKNLLIMKQWMNGRINYLFTKISSFVLLLVWNLTILFFLLLTIFPHHLNFLNILLFILSFLKKFPHFLYMFPGLNVNFIRKACFITSLITFTLEANSCPNLFNHIQEYSFQNYFLVSLSFFSQ